MEALGSGLPLTGQNCQQSNVIGLFWTFSSKFQMQFCDLFPCFALLRVFLISLMSQCTFVANQTTAKRN